MRAAAGVAPYPAAAGLRRRAARQQAMGEAFPPVAGAAAGGPENNYAAAADSPSLSFSQLYTILSALAAILAIIAAPTSSPGSVVSSKLLHDASLEDPVDLNTLESIQAAMNSIGSSSTDEAASSDEQATSLVSELNIVQSVKDLLFGEEEEENGECDMESSTSTSKKTVPALFRWMTPNHDRQEEDDYASNYKNPFLKWLIRFIDPAVLRPRPSSLTDILDKVLTSTPRLLAIANLLLSMTWLVHTAVVDMFLGNSSSGGGGSAVFPAQDNLDNANTMRQQQQHHNSWAGRERLGGYLIFKLLLISAVVVPDTLDLMILLSWYTLLSFLRSLSHLAGATTNHTASSGQAPRKGVLKLLIAVLVSDILAAAVCILLFHGAGWGMVLLLTCDCALLACDVVCHLLRHVSQALEEAHSQTMRTVEEEQLHAARHNNNSNNQEEEEENDGLEDEETEEPATELTSHLLDEDDNDQQQQDDENSNDNDSTTQLDRRMELLETTHARRLELLDVSIYVIQLFSYTLTVAHFLHIWTLHGLQFTLIDGVLALHLHSAISAAGKKIAERRNVHRIARALDGLFEDATELEMRKAMACGDVCCICLGTMSGPGQVKKVGCGHLYHTHCLREVVERARSIEAAKCPLCRASVVDGRQDNNNNNNNRGGDQDNNNNNNNGERGGVGQAGQAAQPQGAAGMNNNNNNGNGEHALFRFSTENILPAWLPLPAFSFEVVRRPTNNNNNAANAAAGPPPPPPDTNNNDNNAPSFWRRLFVMAGAIPMSPEEEARALAQLVDMFPQYDRNDLQRELRDRRSPEAVVESVLQGVFRGVPRGNVNDVPAAQRNDGGAAQPLLLQQQQEAATPADDQQ